MAVDPDQIEPTDVLHSCERSEEFLSSGISSLCAIGRLILGFGALFTHATSAGYRVTGGHGPPRQLLPHPGRAVTGCTW